MKRMMTFAAFAVLVPCAAIGATDGGWVRFNPPRDVIAARRQALLALRCDGATHVRNLQQVGDYWQATANAAGKHREVYLFDNGSLWIGHRPATPPKPAALPEACQKASKAFG